jgi:hypothetical protein
MMIPVVAFYSLGHDGTTSLGEAVCSGGVSLQGGCFCVARRWMWRGPHEFEVFMRVRIRFCFAVVVGRSSTMGVWLEDDNAMVEDKGGNGSNTHGNGFGYLR